MEVKQSEKLVPPISYPLLFTHLRTWGRPLGTRISKHSSEPKGMVWVNNPPGSARTTYGEAANDNKKNVKMIILPLTEVVAAEDEDDDDLTIIVERRGGCCRCCCIICDFCCLGSSQLAPLAKILASVISVSPPMARMKLVAS